MFSTYIKIALRSLWKNKISSIINVVGLAVGLTSCLLIALYVQHEQSFDSFQPNGNRIGRVIMKYAFDGSPESKEGNYTSTKVAPVFSRTFPEVEAGVRMEEYEILVMLNNSLVKEPTFMFADSTFFKTFYYTMLSGNPKVALDGPNKVVLTSLTAKKYFGDQPVLGKTLYVGPDKTPYEVTGVIEDYPANSQFRFDFLASFSSLGANQEETYWDANYTTYLLLQHENSFESLQEKIEPFMKKEMASAGATIHYTIEHFDKIHLRSPYDAFVPNVNISYLYILSAIALLILVIVCFTYINLSTARSVDRAREIGVRKVVGAARSQVFWQFIGESTILCFLSILLSQVFSLMALPWFNALTEEQLTSTALFNPIFVFFMIMGTLLVSFLAGAYPAIVLSGFQPVKVLKSVFKNTRSGKTIQQSLIVFQFAISVFLIAATIIIQLQLEFIQNHKLGYDREHVLNITLHPKLWDKIELVKDELKTTPGVVNLSVAQSAPVHIPGGYNMRSAAMPATDQLSVTGNPIDNGYLPTTGLQLVAGENITEQDMKDVSTDKWEDHKYHFILNESAARQLGWTPDEAIGKNMFMGDDRPGSVRGVVKDFHFESMHSPIGPLVLFTQREGRRLLVKISGDHMNETIASIEEKWKQLASEMPFDYRFMDDDYNKLYHSELQLGSVMKIFTAIAILLACVGLFGLSIDVVQQRVKEIGIRRILGASGLSIVSLISGTFIRLVLVSIVIASPIAWWALGHWLEGFAYRIDMMWWMFAMSGILAIVIALLTVSVQGVKAMMMNPADSLKVE